MGFLAASMAGGVGWIAERAGCRNSLRLVEPLISKWKLDGDKFPLYLSQEDAKYLQQQDIVYRKWKLFGFFRFTCAWRCFRGTFTTRLGFAAASIPVGGVGRWSRWVSDFSPMSGTADL